MNIEVFQESLNDIENRFGIRASWTVIPAGSSSQLSVPLSYLYTPLKKIANLQRLPYQPTACRSCGFVLSPYASLDQQSMAFVCPNCYQRGPLGAEYRDISQDNLPQEMLAENQTIEYVLPSAKKESKPIIFFALDACSTEEEWDQLKSVVEETIGNLPGDARVGLITFGSTVHVHELAYAGFAPRSFVFRGHQQTETKRVAEMLQLTVGAPQKLIMTVDECSLYLPTIIEDLQRDSWPVAAKSRPLRCTGAALSMAQSIVSSIYPTEPARIMLFASGPCTIGPGQIADRNAEISIRSHINIRKRDKTAQYVDSAIEYYGSLGTRAVNDHHTIDIFACGLDQVGVYEMRQLSTKTGGEITLRESFNDDDFTRNLGLLVENYVKSFNRPDELATLDTDDQSTIIYGHGMEMEVVMSPELRINGCIGSCDGAPISDPSAIKGSKIIGVSNTNKWRASSFNSNSSFAVFMEIVSSANQEVTSSGTQKFIQFRTSYLTPRGQRVLRVTTMGYHWVGRDQWNHIAGGFDQDTAAVCLAKMSCWLADNGMFEKTVIGQIDHSIIKLCARFGEYRKGEAMSFKLIPNFELFPQFLFHFRRSPFLQVTGYSPDETAYLRHALARENCMNCLTMMQPVLISFTVDREPTPALLDSTSARHDVILLMDSYFNLTIWNGKTIVEWRNAGYHEQPEYANLAQLFALPVAEAEELRLGRLPQPDLMNCDQGSSAARRILSRLNPTNTHKGSDGSVNGAGGEMITTDDLSIQKFLEHLRRAAVDQ